MFEKFFGKNFRKKSKMWPYMWPKMWPTSTAGRTFQAQAQWKLDVCTAFDR